MWSARMIHRSTPRLVTKAAFMTNSAAARVWRWHNRAGLGGTGRTLAVTALPCGLVRIMASSGNHAREGGGAIFYVSNDRTGTLLIQGSTLHGNPNDGFFTAGYPGIFFLGQGHPVVISSTISAFDATGRLP